MLIGDFDAEIFDNQSYGLLLCTYRFKILIKKPTCNTDNPTCIDLVLTNFPRQF